METLTITWSWEDVFDQYERLHNHKQDYLPLTKDECCQILEHLEEFHDCNIGINWQEIDYATKDILRIARD